MNKINPIKQVDLERIVEMAWEDRTPFDAIERQFGIPENETIKILRQELKQNSFKLWRERVQGRSTKHAARSPEKVSRFKSRMQKGIAGNKISKKT